MNHNPNSAASFHQGQFASRPEFERGLLATRVAPRAGLLARAEDRDLLWFLQGLSHKPGGLNKLAGDLLRLFPERNAPASLQKLGSKPGQNLGAEQVKAIRAEIPGGEDRFILRGEMGVFESICLPDIPTPHEDLLHGGREEALRRHSEADARTAQHSKTYSVESFLAVCREAASDLPEFLSRLCLDPAIEFETAGVWYFPGIIQTLRDYKADCLARLRGETVFTALGKRVSDTLDFSLKSRLMSLIEGLPRMGKTHSAQSWCELHSGQARYVQVPSTPDDVCFYRAIARSLGVSMSLDLTAQDLRHRIEAVLQEGNLMLVFDEAHYLWPRNPRDVTTPRRINWIMTALVNQGVPVALVATPQFMEIQKYIEKRSLWASEQFTGRIGHYERLPDTLSDEDRQAVAGALLPGACKKSLQLVAHYAKVSNKRLFAIQSIVQCARAEAESAGRREITFSDLQRTIKETIIPSINNLKRVGSKSAHTAPQVPSRPPLAASETPDPLGGARPNPSRCTEVATLLPAVSVLDELHFP